MNDGTEKMFLELFSAFYKEKSNWDKSHKRLTGPKRKKYLRNEWSLHFEAYFDAIVTLQDWIGTLYKFEFLSFYSNIKLNGNHCKKVSNIEILFKIKSTVNACKRKVNKNSYSSLIVVIKKVKKEFYNNLNFEFPTNSFLVAHFQKAYPFLIT